MSGGDGSELAVPPEASGAIAEGIDLAHAELKEPGFIGLNSGGLCAGWGIGFDGNDDGWNDKGCSDTIDCDCGILFADGKPAEDALPCPVQKW
ncbi:hypothetical protein [Streptomyces sp. HB132]|uniref:hypothetical protein n=1 Tax=Streptomyces sp. HB132 TaxID=767388 RepID=UPI0019606A8B|nr:hypothetical protein [Streptomyces sp. HB132]MBM7439769.1 hypothetical protein [Streptomyces sp. HB132]